MRFGTDSEYLSPVDYDIFEFMHRKKYKYGYRTIKNDKIFATKGLNWFVEKYIRTLRKNLSDVAHLYMQNNYFPKERLEPKIYYNNFEIVHIKSFQKKECRNFANEIDRSYQIYQSRQGGAPLRYASVNIFMNVSKDVWKFCDIDYRHIYSYYSDC